MRYFFRFSLTTLFMTYLLIFIGGLVRVAGAGMGCPDWPKCFGRWIPPTSIEQLPTHIDPAQFNFVLAWIEYCNRLFGVFIGLMITITCFLAIRYHRKEPKIMIPTIGAFILTLIEGWLGGVLVDTVLNPLTITFHLLLALFIVVLLIYAVMQAYYLGHKEAELSSKYSDTLKWPIMGTGLIIFIEIIIGTEIRGGLEIIRKENPLVDSTFLLNMLGPFKYLHTILGASLIGIGYYLRKKLIVESSNPSRLMVISTNTMLVIIISQIILGESLVFLDIKPLIQLFHMWFASLLLGISVVQYIAWERSRLS